MSFSQTSIHSCFDYFPSESEAASSPPVLNAVKASSDEQALHNYWSGMRTFYSTGKGGELPPGMLPATLSPYRDRNLLPSDYPLWLAEKERTDLPLILPLHELLSQAVEKAAPEDVDSLTRFLPQLEERIRQKLAFTDAAFKAGPVLQEALNEWQSGVKQEEEGNSAVTLAEKLKTQLPASGLLLPFSPFASIHLLAVLVRRQTEQGRSAILQETKSLKKRLQELLAVEKEKKDDARSAQKLQESLDFADALLDFKALSSTLPSGEALRIPQERLGRLQELLQRLQSAEAVLADPAYIIKGPGLEDWALRDDFPQCHTVTAPAGKLCQKTQETFDRQMEGAARLFAALRMARLEVEDRYRPELHTEFFSSFDWRRFSLEEWAAAPLILLFARSKDILNKEIDAWSHLLASDRPVKCLFLHFVHKGRPGPYLKASFDEEPFRRELSAMAIAHRSPYVLQASALSAGLLDKGFRQGLSAPAPALFHLAIPMMEDKEDRDAFLLLGSAVESREFPHLLFDSSSGARWGSRFDLQANPQTGNDWPEQKLEISKGKDSMEELSLSFTFADYAVQDGRYGRWFRLVDSAYVTEDLLPVQEYLRLPAGQLPTRLPFIWLVDPEGQLQRAVVARPLVLMCRERLDFWNFLQENAGIHSVHVERATKQLEEKMKLAYAEKVKALEAKHASELKTARESTMRQTIENLLNNLLDDSLETRLHHMAVNGDAAAVMPLQTKVKSSETQEVGEAHSPGEQVGPGEPKPEAEQTEAATGPRKPWIETDLCTSCNDCINTNDRVFEYNAEKQAFVADPQGGPFADIVRAAEKCPVSIIQPGDPWNPDEPNLEKWVKRAEKFQ